MRILFSSTPGAGHVQPMLPLAVALRARGHDLRWAAGEDGCQWVGDAGFEAVRVGLSTRERMAKSWEYWPEQASLRGHERPAVMFGRMFGGVAAPAAFPALLDLAREWRPDVVVTEAADFAAPVVSAAVGVPHATHGFGLVVPPERVRADGEWCASLWDAVSLEPRPYGGLYDHLYLDIYPPSLQPQDLSYVGRIQRRRPESMTSRAGDDLAPDVQAALRDDRPLVYLTFGTVHNVNPDFQATVDALARMPDVVALVTVGPDGDVDGFGAQPDHVTVSRYVPQSEVLPRCAAVVSHGGSGTLLGALSLGIPQVCVPQAADQFRNANACTLAGAAVALTGDGVTADAVEAAVRRALADPGLRAAAGRIAQEIAAMPPVEAAADAVESLAG